MNIILFLNTQSYQRKIYQRAVNFEQLFGSLSLIRVNIYTYIFCSQSAFCFVSRTFFLPSPLIFVNDWENRHMHVRIIWRCIFRYIYICSFVIIVIVVYIIYWTNHYCEICGHIFGCDPLYYNGKFHPLKSRLIVIRCGNR